MVNTNVKRIQNENTILSTYLKEINKIPLLSREEEYDLAIKAVAGDKDAQDKLIKANLRFVVNVAKKYQNQGLPLMDLVSEGNIGLMNAVERFDATKGYHFISYAVWWIRQAILKAVCEKSRMIRLPLNRANELVQIDKARKEVDSSKGEENELREIAGLLNMSQDHVRDILNISRDMVSLDVPVFADRDGNTIGDFLEDSRYEQPEESMIENALRDDIDAVLATLTEKEARILRLRFGLNGNRAMSLKEIGDRFNLTKERIRQIEKKAIRRLQNPARMSRLEAYVA
ncbi:MAG TPA: RNA polymerase sigma factor RpoD/SigA [Treponemataceae bacterium]|jgi:RNA polymerase primary sigma factor|nr:MAG: RNA polymerase sigma factor SigA [Spirochaetes bacterium ADurb.Bin215]HOF84647.1 RNA polymerase sigma factor RpoD/SigA [Treponemataceae bacterium]HOS35143.1 RNA polymerase sigma factor RpoD/SigA [Treponemataceae bacterium]HOU38048.1 RNA polymerase sigma factor RpoD/SigA [Treponemataceae bacterium]HPA10539.1 RNA polymerase sigma factor RpoD/SigA [Treponemataceae bacterium]